VASAGRVRCPAQPAPPPPAGSGRRGWRAGCPSATTTGLDRGELGRVGREALHHQPAPLGFNQAGSARLRWAGSPSPSQVAFSPPRKRRSSASTVLRGRCRRYRAEGGSRAGRRHLGRRRRARPPRGLLPGEPVLEHRRRADRRPAAADVRVRLSAVSSKTTRQALCRWALPHLWPPFLAPAVDRVLVAFGSPTLGRWTLQPSRWPSSAHTQAGWWRTRDGARSRWRSGPGPQLPDEPVGAGALQQGLFNLTELAVGQPGCWAGRSLAAQRVRSSGPPALVPSCPLWRETPSRRATSAWRTPVANTSAARSRRPGAAGVRVAPQGGERRWA
jgi:hypothetical protein